MPHYLDEALRDRGVDERLLATPTMGCSKPTTLTRPPGTGKKVALTFDDGPTPGTTEQMIEILEEEGVNATFFHLGFYSRRYPDLERKVWESGNTVGVHAWDHTDLTTLTPDATRTQLQRTAREIVRNTGAPVCFFRPTYGSTNEAVRREAFALGFTEVLWTIDSRDWLGPSTNIVENATRVFDSAPVNVLLHSSLPELPDGSDAPLTSTVASLRPVIEAYKSMGYEFVQVDGSPFPERNSGS